MNDELLKAVVEELWQGLPGCLMGKVFQLGRAQLAIDFRTGQGNYLLIAAESSQPRLYLIKRTVRELEKQSLAPSSFALVLRKHLGGAKLVSVMKDELDRIVRFTFAARDATGNAQARTFIAQLTGRSSNLFLLDAQQHIIDSLRPAHGSGQEIGELYAAPPTPIAPLAEPAQPSSQATSFPTPPRLTATSPPQTRGTFASLSEALDDYFRRLERARAFDARAAAHTARLRQASDKLRKLQRNLTRDLAAHGEAEGHKRIGDLLLANISTAERRGSQVRLTDYYAEGAPEIELEIDEHRTLPEEAAHRFARYTKAKRAAQEIAQRLARSETELAALEVRRAELARIIATRDPQALDAFDENKGAGRRIGTQRGGTHQDLTREKSGATSSKTAAAVPGTRRYRSTDGYEILVGRAARDNDHLTFRVARSHDGWLHAADYPGSHVIIRNHARQQEIPQRTIIEAAQLAAHFSQARTDTKVAVHYTPRKFVSKIKGGAPGLVRLSSFRTLLVEPGETVERI